MYFWSKVLLPCTIIGSLQTVGHLESPKSELFSAYRQCLKPCPQAQFCSLKNIKTYLSHPKKGTFGGLAGVALSRGWDIPLDTKKKIFAHSFIPPAQLFPLCVGCLVGCHVGCCVVVVLLLCCCCVVVVVFIYFVAALPTLRPPPPPLSVGVEVDIISLPGT